MVWPCQDSQFLEYNVFCKALSTESCNKSRFDSALAIINTEKARVSFISSMSWIQWYNNIHVDLPVKTYKLLRRYDIWNTQWSLQEVPFNVENAKSLFL